MAKIRDDGFACVRPVTTVAAVIVAIAVVGMGSCRTEISSVSTMIRSYRFR